MSSGPETFLLPHVTVQHDIGTVMDEVKQGTVLAEDAWVSCYLQGATSVHGKTSVSLSNDDSSKFALEGTEGISTTWLDRVSSIGSLKPWHGPKHFRFQSILSKSRVLH